MKSVLKPSIGTITIKQKNISDLRSGIKFINETPCTGDQETILKTFPRSMADQIFILMITTAGRAHPSLLEFFIRLNLKVTRWSLLVSNGDHIYILSPQSTRMRIQIIKRNQGNLSCLSWFLPPRTNQEEVQIQDIQHLNSIPTALGKMEWITTLLTDKFLPLNLENELAKAALIPSKFFFSLLPNKIKLSWETMLVLKPSFLTFNCFRTVLRLL